MRKIARFLLPAALLAYAAAAMAVPVAGLYNASVPVEDQSPAKRSDALRQALAVVLVRVSGDRRLPASDAGLDLLRQANNFLQGYGYEAAGEGLQLGVRFDPHAINRALRELGMPVWGSNRLSHQMWVLLRDDGAAPAILDGEGAETRAPALLQAARERGIPLVFPTLDETDRQLVEFRQVWDGDFRGVRGAGSRYRPDTMVVVRAGREGRSWLTRWSLLHDDGREESWNRLQPSLDLALAEGLHELADRQARRFAVQTGMQQAIRVQVSGINSIDAYARVLGYLRGLNPVRAALVEEVEPGVVRFRLEVEGDPQLLPRIIGAGSLLYEDVAGEGIAELRYTLAH